MADPTRDALLVAVVSDVKRETARHGIVRLNGAGPLLWPFVATIMKDLTGDDVPKNTWRNRFQRAVKGLSQAEIASLDDTVDPRRYRPLVLEALKSAAKATDGAEKSWTPPPNRSNDPAERVQERKAEILRQHDRKVAAQLVEQQALNEMLVDAVTLGVKLAPPIKVRSVPEILIVPSPVEEVPVALLSDTHAGALVLPDEMGGLNEFDLQIAIRRLDTYQERICAAIDLHRKGAIIKKMVVYMLGDMNEGEIIFDGQAFRIELVITDQLFELASYLIGWLLGILSTGLVEEIHVICVVGNHGRTTHKKGASKSHSNWDYVLYKHMEAVLANEPRIKWYIPKAWFALVDIMGWRIYGTHGEVIKSWMGIPFYGIQRHDMRTTTLLQSVGMDYYGMVYGDKHIAATLPRVKGWQVMNGSIVGGSDFSMHQLGTASEPMQTMFGINANWGKTWQYDFVLDRRSSEEIRKHLAFTKI